MRNPGAYRRRVGDVQVVALSDGFADLPHAIWRDIAPETVDRALERHFLPPGGIRAGVTCYVIETGSRLILVDGGAAGEFGPNLGRLPQSLTEASISPAEIDTVLVSHLHPDHIGGLFDEDVPALPNARLHVHESELAFWDDPAAESRAVDLARPWFEVVRRWRRAWGDRIETFTGERGFGDGITAVPLPGHTPGHVGYLVESAGESLLIANDLVFSAAINFADPDAAMVWETDPALAACTRRRMLDSAATDRLLLAATHMQFPSFAHVVRQADAYAWVPEPWRHEPEG